MMNLNNFTIFYRYWHMPVNCYECKPLPAAHSQIRLISIYYKKIIHGINQ